jgi:hypothetical protein
VLQTFAASLTACQGARNIDGLDDPDNGVARSYGGLALAAAAVSVAVITYNLISPNVLPSNVGRARIEIYSDRCHHHRDGGKGEG